MAKIRLEFKYVDDRGRGGEGKIEGNLSDAKKLLDDIFYKLGVVAIKEKPIEKRLVKKEYRKKSSAWYLSKLINETDFFKEEKVRTTTEIIERIWIKFHKKIRAKDASRDFFILVKNKELDNDFIPRCRQFPRGAYVWFLPGTLRQEIERFKEQFK